ncbi:hypothetical protein [Roseococcus sp.]|uniref:hypothetical protein n=1 Tax=Roseococcus sp. TaxID=2109646 RepID=UPI003BA972FE
MSAESRAPFGQLRLECRPGRAEGTLTFPYQLTNMGPVPLLVMEAWPRLADGKRSADAQVAQVILRPDGVAMVGKYIPSVPPGMRIPVPVLPLCLLLKPTETVTRELRIPLPLAEQSPYLPELRLSGYTPRELKGLIFAIGWWPATQPGLAAGPAGYAPDLQTVAALDGLPAAGTAMQRFPTTRLDIMRRRDAFPRSVPAHPELA